MTEPKRLFLVGPMGAGKSTIGKRLAQRLQLDFADSDKEIEKRTGASIALIFELEGEQGFRQREASIIDELSNMDKIVLATGGGAILSSTNRDLLRQRGTTIYLQTSVEFQLQRTSRDSKRPLLQTENPRKKLEELLAIRDPLYRELADIIVRTDGRHVNAVVSEIIRQICDNNQKP